MLIWQSGETERNSRPHFRLVCVVCISESTVIYLLCVKTMQTETMAVPTTLISAPRGEYCAEVASAANFCQEADLGRMHDDLFFPSPFPPPPFSARSKAAVMQPHWHVHKLGPSSDLVGRRGRQSLEEGAALALGQSRSNTKVVVELLL